MLPLFFYKNIIDFRRSFMSEKFVFKWGKDIYVKGGRGDTWDPTWCDDDILYTPANDTSGFFCDERRNIAFATVTGNDVNNLIGENVNLMDDYGGHAEKKKDNCTWKSSGAIYIDGTIYFAVGRHCYGFESGDYNKRQTVRCASIIKSNDGGKTWTPGEDKSYNEPMFGSEFGTPYFIHYGKNYDTSFAPKEDMADKYVYAISNNGFWDNGDSYILGRVRKDMIDRLDANDWEYLKSDDGKEWGKDPKEAYKIIRSTLGCGETGATYIPEIGKYMLVSWRYLVNGRDKPDETEFGIYVADHPWGPWEKQGFKYNFPEGWYCPRILSKFQEPVTDGVRVYVCTAGDYSTSFGQKEPDYYKMVLMPLIIKRVE